MNSNRIEKQIELKAPLHKVWKALTDYRQFGEWFCVKIEAPFEPGKPSTGMITHPGYEHVRWTVTIQKIEPGHQTFSFTWHPYAVDENVDYSKETPTLVEFKLEEISGGTLLTVTESGFENIPAHRRLEAFRMNTEGWEIQMSENIKTYVEKT